MKYLLLLLLILAGCSGSKNLSSDKLLTVQKATVQKSIGGAPGSGISHTYLLDILFDTDKSIHFDSLWVAEKPGMGVRVLRADREMYGKAFEKGEVLTIRARSISNSSNKQETSGGPAPIDFEGDALLGFTLDDSKKMYLVIEKLEVLEKQINP